MLVISRKRHQSIQIGHDIRLTLVKIEGQGVRLGIEAPEGIPIWREELLWRDGGPSADEPRPAAGAVDVAG